MQWQATEVQLTVFTQEIRKKIRTASSEYPITLISEEEKVSSFKN